MKVKSELRKITLENPRNNKRKSATYNPTAFKTTFRDFVKKIECQGHQNQAKSQSCIELHRPIQPEKIREYEHTYGR